MDPSLNPEHARGYMNNSQRARRTTERWVAEQFYCLNCGISKVLPYPNNSPIADFYCAGCDENYELKSLSKQFGAKLLGGAYTAMIERLLEADAHPNYILLSYDLPNLIITDLFVIPKHFFNVEIIEERKPLAPTAQRAGFVGCTILLQSIPDAGRIAIIEGGIIHKRTEARKKRQRTLFLRSDRRASESKGWLLNIIRCIERIGKRTFLLQEVYDFQAELSRAYPGNRHVQHKIRQQLQILRNKQYLDFLGDGKYRLR